MEINKEEYLFNHVSHIGIHKVVNGVVEWEYDYYYFLCDIHHVGMICILLNHECYTDYIDDKIAKITFKKHLLDDMPKLKEYSDRLNDVDGNDIMFIVEVYRPMQDDINKYLEHYRLFRFINYYDAFRLEDGYIIGYGKDEECEEGIDRMYYERDDFEMDISNYELPIILNDIFRDNRFFEYEYQNNKYTFEGVIFYKK